MAKRRRRGGVLGFLRRAPKRTSFKRYMHRKGRRIGTHCRKISPGRKICYSGKSRAAIKGRRRKSKKKTTSSGGGGRSSGFSKIGTIPSNAGTFTTQAAGRFNSSITNALELQANNKIAKEQFEKNIRVNAGILKLNPNSASALQNLKTAMKGLASWNTSYRIDKAIGPTVSEVANIKKAVLATDSKRNAIDIATTFNELRKYIPKDLLKKGPSAQQQLAALQGLPAPPQGGNANVAAIQPVLANGVSQEPRSTTITPTMIPRPITDTSLPLGVIVGVTTSQVAESTALQYQTVQMQEALPLPPPPELLRTYDDIPINLSAVFEIENPYADIPISTQYYRETVAPPRPPSPPPLPRPPSPLPPLREVMDITPVEEPEEFREELMTDVVYLDEIARQEVLPIVPFSVVREPIVVYVEPSEAVPELEMVEFKRTVPRPTVPEIETVREDLGGSGSTSFAFPQIEDVDPPASPLQIFKRARGETEEEALRNVAQREEYSSTAGESQALQRFRKTRRKTLARTARGAIKFRRHGVVERSGLSEKP